MPSTTDHPGASGGGQERGSAIPRALVAAALFGVTFACGIATTRARHPLVDGLHDPPPDIRTACLLAETRCSQCHSLDRVLAVDLDSPSHWRRYVARMRRKPGSEIAPDEAPALVRCLVFRNFGEAGLEQLDTGAPP